MGCGGRAGLRLRMRSGGCPLRFGPGYGLRSCPLGLGLGALRCRSWTRGLGTRRFWASGFGGALRLWYTGRLHGPLGGVLGFRTLP
jgi:hypothetical protein